MVGAPTVEDPEVLRRRIVTEQPRRSQFQQSFVMARTLLRTYLIVFLVNEHSFKSGVCSVEAFASFFSTLRPQGNPFAVLVNEQAQELPDYMWNLPAYTYKPGTEGLLAERLAVLVQSDSKRASE